MKRFLLVAALKAIALLPWPAIQALGRVVGELLVRIPNRQRRDALINIRLCFPDMDEARQLDLRRRTMIHFAKTYVELSAMWVWRKQRVLRLVCQEFGTELLRKEPDEGLIVLAPHLGSWELAGLYMANKGPITSMYRPQRHIDDIILAARQRNGAQLVPDNMRGVKQMLRTLKKGGVVGILPDQVTREENAGVFAPFFGVPAVTMLLVARLSRRTGARVVCLFAERRDRGAGFYLHCLPTPPGIDDPDDLVAATALNQAVEHCIEQCPEQYHWTYRRFRRRPGGAPTPYTGPSV